MSTATEVNPRLKRLTEAGVSVWLDQIRRSLTEGGELERLVAEDSLRGVTSNPSIFEKAILGSKDYDDELVQYAREQLDAEAIYDRIAIHDVQLGRRRAARRVPRVKRARRLRVARGRPGPGPRRRSARSRRAHVLGGAWTART